MSDNKTYLKLHKPESQNAMALFRSRYEVLQFNYQFSKSTLKTGEPNSYTTAGSINITLAKLPTEELFRWMADKHKLENGELTSYNLREEVLEQLYFEQGRLIGLRHVYNREGVANTMGVELTIVAKRMIVGETEYNNKEWK